METENNNNPLVHCIYSSVGMVDFSKDDIITLLEKARSNNARQDVTGMLLYDKGSFFQVLEGHPDSVLEILDKVQRDERHSQVVRIIYEEIEERSFSEWTMGYSEISQDELAEKEGLNDFFKLNKSYIDLDEGRAKTLLKAFKDGQWRSSIN